MGGNCGANQPSSLSQVTGRSRTWMPAAWKTALATAAAVANDADLACAARARRVGVLVDVIDPGHLDRGDVGFHFGRPVAAGWSRCGSSRGVGCKLSR
jgi:hypothetical protein